MKAQGHAKPMRPPQEPLLLSGTAPGLLDKSQRARLLRDTNSRLSFATFDPFTASAENVQSTSSSADRCKSKRIVIETFPDGHSSWRWIPNARKEQGVDDEGDISTRIVNICGTPFRMTQEQWDIYKLDPFYDCCVKPGLAMPTITLKGFGAHVPLPQEWSSSTASMRTASPTSSFTTVKPDASMRTAASPTDNEEDRMSVDDEGYVPRTPKRATKEMPRRGPRFQSKASQEPKFSTPGPSSEEPSSARKAKRSRATSPDGFLRPTDDAEIQFNDTERNTKFYTSNVQKRARTLSPSSKNRNLTNAKMARDKAKARRLNQQKERHKQQKQQFEEDKLDEDTPFDAPPPQFGNGPKFTDIPEEEEEEMEDEETQRPPPEPTQPEPEPVDDEEASRRRVAESVRKLAEMNLNRPNERERERKSKAPETPVEPKTRRAKTEAPPGQEEQRRKKFEAAMQEELRRKQELEEARRKEAQRLQEQERRRSELRAKAAREREIRTREWTNCYWDHQTALDRYKKQAVFFDKEKFSEEENPLTFIDVPWPTLTHPLMTRPEDLEYDSVTQFLETARMYLQPSEFNSLVIKSRLRFHPDRWSNRRLLNAIVDINERNEVQTIITTVSQAMNCAYDTVKPKHA